MLEFEGLHKLQRVQNKQRILGLEKYVFLSSHTYQNVPQKWWYL